MTAAVPSVTWRALGTTVVVLASKPDLADAAASARRVLDEIDQACSRFREDSELSRVSAAGGVPMRVSRLFIRATRCALRAARLTDGDLDPTIGSSLRAAGYDRDFAAVRAGGAVCFRRAGGWRTIELDDAHSVVRVPPGIELDYGATAKALAADIAADAAAQDASGGVLVNIGGDIATAGAPPPEGWSVRVTDDHASAGESPGQTVALRGGGLATSSTTVRRWTRDEVELHHILDPASGRPVAGGWRTVSVAAACCVDANIASTAAIVRGERAAAWLERLGLPSRLVGIDGAVRVVGGWPARQPCPR